MKNMHGRILWIFLLAIAWPIYTPTCISTLPFDPFNNFPFQIVLEHAWVKRKFRIDDFKGLTTLGITWITYGGIIS